MPDLVYQRLRQILFLHHRRLVRHQQIQQTLFRAQHLQTLLPLKPQQLPVRVLERLPQILVPRPLVFHLLPIFLGQLHQLPHPFLDHPPLLEQRHHHRYLVHQVLLDLALLHQSLVQLLVRGQLRHLETVSHLLYSVRPPQPGRLVLRLDRLVLLLDNSDRVVLLHLAKIAFSINLPLDLVTCFQVLLH